MTVHAELLQKLDTRTVRIGIIGLGYVGLPLARACTESGFQVLGFDVNPVKIDLVQKGESYLRHLPSKSLRDMRDRGFEATSNMERLAEPDCLLICVPTPLDEKREPDLSYVNSAGKTIARTLRRGQLVILESSTYPGTTRQLLLPILEASGLRVTEDFYLAYSPEREDPGNRDFRLQQIPKVVGGIDAASLEVAAAFYERVVAQVVRVSNSEVAEASKLLENTYRCVNIALVNELKVLFDRIGVDVWEVVAAAKTKPFGFQAFEPGPGPGGHCIPVDPVYLAWVGRAHGVTSHFIELAGVINAGMPAYVVGKVTEALRRLGKPLQGSRVAVMGVAYKRDIDDTRESPAWELMHVLQAAGTSVTYHDPYVAVLPWTPRYGHLQGLKSQPLTVEHLASQDCVVILTDHSVYDWDWVVEHSTLIVDTRNATRNVVLNRDRIVKA